jgi:hypothetical protein
MKPIFTKLELAQQHFVKKTTVPNFMKIRHTVSLLITGHGRTDGRRNVVWLFLIVKNAQSE